MLQSQAIKQQFLLYTDSNTQVLIQPVQTTKLNFIQLNELSILRLKTIEPSNESNDPLKVEFLVQYESKTNKITTVGTAVESLLMTKGRTN